MKKFVMSAAILMLLFVATAAGAAESEKELGVKLYEGAQVRLGRDAVTDKKIASADSGIRFIAEVNRTDTLAGMDGAEIGIAVTADGSDNIIHIPAERYQVNESVFSAAIVNISEENFNRMFIASPYVKIDEQYYYGAKVSRSIYQVAAGLLKNNDGRSEYMYEVLNAYVNQTGIRLSFSDTGASDAFIAAQMTGDPFFTVENVEYNLGKYTVTLKSVGNADIYDYWNEKIRVNNNNTTASTFIKDTVLNEDTLTFTFDLEKYLFDQTENVMIVGSVSDKEITGFRGGEAVSYEFNGRIDVMGLSDNRDDIMPGAVILPALDANGKCGAVDILALPGERMAEYYGVHEPSDGSQTYSNIVGRYSGKDGTTVKVFFPPEQEKTNYVFTSRKSKYYRFSNADGETKVTQYNISNKDGIPQTSEYNVYIYMRYNNETGRVTEAVMYATPTDYNPGAGDGDYSPVYRLERPEE